jgi:hypothetical protein
MMGYVWDADTYLYMHSKSDIIRPMEISGASAAVAALAPPPHKKKEVWMTLWYCEEDKRLFEGWFLFRTVLEATIENFQGTK